jgi:hypothetical protein
MKTIKEKQLRKQIRVLIYTFMILLVLSGISAFPLEWELSLLVELTQNLDPFIKEWVIKVHDGYIDTNNKYPFIAYGTDWLAFAHIVIAIAFVGPLKDPVKNIWVIQFGMISCILVFPLALICGPIRHIPFFWQLIDCSFGIAGIVPLYISYKKTIKLKQLITINQPYLNPK